MKMAFKNQTKHLHSSIETQPTAFKLYINKTILLGE